MGKRRVTRTPGVSTSRVLTSVTAMRAILAMASFVKVRSTQRNHLDTTVIRNSYVRER